MLGINQVIDFIKNIPIETILDIVIAIIIIMVFKLVSGTFSYYIIKLFKLKATKKEIKATSFFKPLKRFFVVLGIYVATWLFLLSDNTILWINKIFRIACICLVANGLANAVSAKSTLFSVLKDKDKLPEDDTVVNFISKIVKTVVYVIAGFTISYELGYNLNGLIAGLGLGGVVVALAAQDIAKNLFGGMAIFIDKPFIVGDWIETGKYEGVIEDITFRSTRIRTFENAVVNIPNNTIANESVTNWSKMEKRRYKTNILVERGTSLERLQNVEDKITFMLQNHSNVIPDEIYVKFDEIKESGINILVYAYTNSTDYATYMEAKEHINYNIIKILEHEGIKIAYPTQSIYIKSEEDSNKVITEETKIKKEKGVKR